METMADTVGKLLAMIFLIVLIVVANLVLLGGAVWVVISVLKWTGVM